MAAVCAHHYLSGALEPGGPLLPGPVAWRGRWRFAPRVSLIGRKNRWRISRMVTLPDYQGLGIGMAVAEAVADLHRARGTA